MGIEMYEKNIIGTGKVVVVGDGACGKTCLLEVFKRGRFPDEYIPTVVDNFTKDVTYDDKTITLILWDTAGQDQYDSVRPLSYKDTDLVLLCYTVENIDFLENIKNKWLLELKNYCPNAGFFLVGLKSDVGDIKDGSINADKFIECSALTGYNVQYLFEEVAKHIAKLSEEGRNVNESGYYCCGLCG